MVTRGAARTRETAQAPAASSAQGCGEQAQEARKRTLSNMLGGHALMAAVEQSSSAAGQERHGSDKQVGNNGGAHGTTEQCSLLHTTKRQACHFVLLDSMLRVHTHTHTSTITSFTHASRVHWRLQEQAPVMHKLSSPVKVEAGEGGTPGPLSVRRRPRLNVVMESA